ncbi:MAG: 50S ribosomal protein L18Ae [Candidatus Hodarchaeota archaeon]
MSKQPKTRKKAPPKQEVAEPDVKVFLVEGSYREKNQRAMFKKEIRALQPEHAKERIYRELGSRHKLKMRDISISTIKEIDPAKTEIKDRSVAYLSSEEAKKLQIPTR